MVNEKIKKKKKYWINNEEKIICICIKGSEDTFGCRDPGQRVQGRLSKMMIQSPYEKWESKKSF